MSNRASEGALNAVIIVVFVVVALFAVVCVLAFWGGFFEGIRQGLNGGTP